MWLLVFAESKRHLLISSFFAPSPSFLTPPSSSPSSSVLVPPLCLASSRTPLHGRRLIGGAVGTLLGELRGERQPQRAPPGLRSGPAGPAGSRCSPLTGAGPADLRPVPSHLPPGGHPALHRAQEKAMPRAALPRRGPGAGQAPLALPWPGPHPVACIWLSAQSKARGSGCPGHACR